MARELKATDPKSAVIAKPKVLIFGPAGVGKTFLSLEFPSVYYIDTEAGATLPHYTDKLKASGGAYFGREQGSCDFPTVIEEVQTLASVQHSYRTLVIDSFSKLFNTCMDASAEKLKKEGRKIEFSIEKKEPVAHTRRLIRWLDKLDMNVVLICHQKDKWQGGEMIGATFDGYDKLDYELHLCLQIIKTGGTRNARVTKSRIQQFPDAEIFPWTFAEFAKRFGANVIESAAVPIALATTDQVQRLNRLIEVLKVDADTLTKWTEKAGVDNFSEMDTLTIAKCVDYLEAKIPKQIA